MIIYGVSRYLTRGLCLVDNIHKVFPLRISEEVLQVTRKPKLDIFSRFMRVRLEFRGEGLDDFWFHELER